MGNPGKAVLFFGAPPSAGTASALSICQNLSNGNVAVLRCRTPVVIPGTLLSGFFRDLQRNHVCGYLEHPKFKETETHFPSQNLLDSIRMKPKEKAIAISLHGSFQMLPATCETYPNAMRRLGLATTGASNGATGASGRKQHVYKLH